MAAFCLISLSYLTSKQQFTNLRKAKIISKKHHNGTVSSLNSSTTQTVFMANISERKANGINGSISTQRQPTLDAPKSLPLDDHAPRLINYKGIIFPEPDCRKKLLVYVCTYGPPCGGLADRQKGMISAFLLAIMTNRSLAIKYTNPCNIENFLQPNLYNWLKCTKDIEKYSNSTHEIKGYLLGFVNPFNFPKDLERYNGSDLWEEHVVSVHVNTRLQLLMKANKAVAKHLPWLMAISDENMIKYLYEILFKNEIHLNHEISDFLQKNINHSYLTCAHIRVGQNPSFKGVYRDASFLNQEHVKKIFHFIQSKLSLKQEVLFLATDAEQVRVIARQQFPNLVFLNTSIEHIDLIRHRSCKGTHDAILEQQILSHCDTLIMTGSGFSRMAAFIGGQMNHIFTSPTKISTEIKEVTLQQLTKLYGPFT